MHIRHRRGFTLVELIVVVVILAVLAAVGAVALGQHATNARAAAAQATAAQIRDAIAARAAADDRTVTDEVAYLWGKAAATPDPSSAFLDSVGVAMPGQVTYAPADGLSLPSLSIAAGGAQCGIVLPADGGAAGLAGCAAVTDGPPPTVLDVAKGTVTFSAGHSYTARDASGNVLSGTYEPGRKGCGAGGAEYCLQLASSATTTNQIVVAGGDQDIVLAGVAIDTSAKATAAVAIQPAASDVTVRLAGPNTLISGRAHAGLEKGNTALLTITDAANPANPGQLTSTGGPVAYGDYACNASSGAGIGGAGGAAASNITVAGGKITATGGSSTGMYPGTPSVITCYGRAGAGIGGGGGASGDTIAVTGGQVTATGGGATGNGYSQSGSYGYGYGQGGAGIGGGGGSRGSNLAVNGGTITAIGGVGTGSVTVYSDYGRSYGQGGAGIGDGGGNATVAGTIAISGGQVTATGGNGRSSAWYSGGFYRRLDNLSYGGPGIGRSGAPAAGATTTISGGTVIATGGDAPYMATSCLSAGAGYMYAGSGIGGAGAASMSSTVISGGDVTAVGGVAVSGACVVYNGSAMGPGGGAGSTAGNVLTSASNPLNYAFATQPITSTPDTWSVAAVGGTDVKGNTSRYMRSIAQ